MAKPSIVTHRAEPQAGTIFLFGLLKLSAGGVQTGQGRPRRRTGSIPAIAAGHVLEYLLGRLPVAASLIGLARGQPGDAASAQDTLRSLQRRDGLFIAARIQQIAGHGLFIAGRARHVLLPGTRLVGRQGRLPFAQRLVGVAQALPGQADLGIERHGLAVGRRRLGRLPGQRAHLAQPDVSPRIAALHPGRCLERRPRIVQAAKPQPRLAQAQVGQVARAGLGLVVRHSLE